MTAAGGDVDAFLAQVSAALGPASVITDRAVLASHEVDWTRRFHGRAGAVVRPGDTAGVSEVVAAATRHGVGLVPQGGTTGLVGGSVPRTGEVVVDLRRLDGVGPVDDGTLQVTAGAGVTLASLQAHAAARGLAFGIDLGARDAATVGGMVATNAGGNHVVRHGTMRHQVLGLEAVLAGGRVLSANLGGLVKDNTGYDLVGLLCGSEGTLGVVTACRLRLLRPPASVVAAMVGYPTVVAALDAARILRRHPDLAALEIVLGGALVEIERHRGRRPPVPSDSAAALLVEVAGSAGQRQLEATLADAVEAGPAPGATAVAVGATERARLWAWRDAVPEAAAALGVVHKADVTIPSEPMGVFLEIVPRLVGAVAPGATTLLYGHVGDGNIHVNVVGPDADDDRAIEAILAEVVALGGSVSAEHGIGVAKRDWLVRQRGPVAVDAMVAVKQALDPTGILNPGVLLP